MIVIGADPGLKGGLALYDSAMGLLRIDRMPIYTRQLTAKRKRGALDEDAVLNYFKLAQFLGAQLLCIEDVGGLPGQSAAGAFTFGYGVGVVVTAARALGYRIERAKPSIWKAKMRCPAGKPATRVRAQEVFPAFAQHWTSTAQSSNSEDGTAEAALIAKYAAENLL